MLTPAFDLSQTDDFLVVIIKAPYAKVSETEIFIDDCDFRFHAKPYFLRLTLPASLAEDGRETAKYDAESGSFTIRVPKANAGQHFEGLDMVTTLLAPRGNREVQQATVEVVSEGSLGQAEAGNYPAEEEEFDWQIEQSPPPEETLTIDGPAYGFANQKSGVFKRLQEELCDVIDLSAADETPAHKRPELKSQQEQGIFDDEHYMADVCDEDETIARLISFNAEWNKEYQQLLKGNDLNTIITLVEEEREIMRKLPRKEYLLDSTTHQQVYLGLVDILLAYAYNHRATEGDNTVESGWTISKLSGTLSWLQAYGSLKEVVTGFYRSSLCYPLFRHWMLSEKVVQDVYQILTLGRRKVLKCFLEIRSVLLKSDMRYILNDLYINDYCVWIQSTSKKNLESLAENLKDVTVSKEDVGFDLPILEQACVWAAEESSSENSDISSNFSSLHIGQSCASSNPGDNSNTTLKSETGTSIRTVDQRSDTSDTNSTDSQEKSSSDYTSESEDGTESSDENIPCESHDKSCDVSKNGESHDENELCGSHDKSCDVSGVKKSSDTNNGAVCDLTEDDISVSEIMCDNIGLIEKNVQTLVLTDSKLNCTGLSPDKDQKTDSCDRPCTLSPKTDVSSLNF